MILTVTCKVCQHQNTLKKKASDRVELAKTNGKDFDLLCKKCLEKCKYHVNQVRASKSKASSTLGIVAVIIEVIIIYFLFNTELVQNAQSIFVYPVIIAIIPMVYFTWLSSEQKSIHSFNRHRL